MNKPILMFFVIALIVFACWGMGFITAASLVDARVSVLTQEVQDQFWKIDNLKLELQRCEYNAGNTQQIVLSEQIWLRK